MRFALSLAALAFCLGAADAQYRVTNRCEPAFVVVDRTGACVCGDSCSCKPGDCPSKCPVASALPARLDIGGVPHECGADGTYRPVGGFSAPQAFAAPMYGGARAGAACANGQCGAPARSAPRLLAFPRR